jgi:hypothetical protein
MIIGTYNIVRDSLVEVSEDLGKGPTDAGGNGLVQRHHII